MAAAVVFREIVGDGLASDPYDLVPGILYRGMAVGQEYNKLYIKNEGDATLANPSHTLTRVTVRNSAGSYVNRKVTKAPADGGDILIAYAAGNGALDWEGGTYRIIFASTLIDATGMAVNERYDLYTKYLSGSGDTIQTLQFKHTIGGS